MNLNTEAAEEIIKEIKQLDENIMRCRLEDSPDIEQIRCFQEMLIAKEQELKFLCDGDIYAPV